jgi:hypothetical protein
MPTGPERWSASRDCSVSFPGIQPYIQPTCSSGRARDSWQNFLVSPTGSIFSIPAARRKTATKRSLARCSRVEIARAKAKGAKVRKRDGFKVYRSLITLGAVLEEPQKWPGRYIRSFRSSAKRSAWAGAP